MQRTRPNSQFWHEGMRGSGNHENRMHRAAFLNFDQTVRQFISRSRWPKFRYGNIGFKLLRMRTSRYLSTSDPRFTWLSPLPASRRVPTTFWTRPRPFTRVFTSARGYRLNTELAWARGTASTKFDKIHKSKPPIVRHASLTKRLTLPWTMLASFFQSFSPYTVIWFT